MQRPIIVLATLLFFASAAWSQSGDSRNAATWYRRAIDQLERVSPAQIDLILDYYDDHRGEPPSPALRAALASSQRVLNFMRRGARQPSSDFNLDWSQGFDLLLPHLSEMRRMARIARVDALVRLRDGDTAGAADRLASLYSVSGHLNSDRILISSLVGASIFKTGDDVVQLGIDQAAFSASDSARLLQSAQQLDPDDPFGMVEAVLGEQEVAVSWLERKYGQAQDRAAMADDMEGFFDEDRAPFEQMAAMSDEEFAAEIDGYDRMMDQVVAAFANPDHEAAMKDLEQIEKELEAGEHGLIAQVLSVSMRRLLERQLEFKAMVRDRVALLEALAKGERTPEDEANAAYFYLRGIEMMRKVPAERFAAITTLADDPARAIDEGLAAALAGTASIVDAFRAGSIKKRCDFSVARPENELRVAPAYLPGMRDAFRLLHADALRLLRAKDRAAATDRLAICYRMVGHLSGDDPLASALLAHRAFELTGALLAPLLDATVAAEADDAARRPLVQAVDRIPRRDPFGYAGSIAATREQLVRPLARLAGRTDQDGLAEVSRAIKGLTGERLLDLLAIFESLSTGKRDSETSEVHSLRPLADVLSLSALERMNLEGQRIVPILVRGELEVLGGRQASGIAPVTQRMRRARSDLRRAASLLRPPRPPATAPAP